MLYVGLIPANTSHSDSVGLMLSQRRRRWANINPTLAKCIVSAGTKNPMGDVTMLD